MQVINFVMNKKKDMYFCNQLDIRRHIYKQLNIITAKYFERTRVIRFVNYI